jgi:hypothetical protein
MRVRITIIRSFYEPGKATFFFYKKTSRFLSGWGGALFFFLSFVTMREPLAVSGRGNKQKNITLKMNVFLKMVVQETESFNRADFY